MKIRMRRSGGLAGIEHQQEFVVESLPSDRAAKIALNLGRLLESQAAAGTEEPTGADMLRYEIEVEKADGERYKIVLIDDGSQPALAELLSALRM